MKDQIEKAVEVLKAGGVVMYPTETCYGLAVDIFNEKAIEKLYRLKGRDFKKPVSILVDSLPMAVKYGDFSERALEMASDSWPGPLTLVVPRRDELPGFLNPGVDYIGIRWSSLELCNDLVAACGFPITTTSANMAGEPPLYTPEDMGANFIIDGGELDSSVSPSRVVRVSGEAVEVLR